MRNHPDAPADEPRGDERLGTALRGARRTRGMTLRDVSQAAGCSDGLLSKIENGRTMPSLQSLRRIVDALGVTMGDVLDAPDVREGTVSRRGRLTVDVPGRSGGRSRLTGDLLRLPFGTTAIDAGADGPEVGIVVDGEVEVATHTDEVMRRLRVGDSFPIVDGQPLRGVGEAPVTVLRMRLDRVAR